MTALAHQLPRTRTASAPRSAPRCRAAWALTAVPVLFLTFDGVIKLMNVQPVVDGMAKLGYPAGLAGALGTILLACVALYAVPRTAFLGAVLLTGYLGGAVATHVRVGDPLVSHVLFPVYVAIFIWGGLYLRDPRLRALVTLGGTHA